MTMTALELFRTNFSSPQKDALQRLRLGKIEVVELLGQARVHVVEMGDAEELAEERADPGRFLVGEDEVGAVLDDPPQGR